MIEERLDRSLANSDWLKLFPSANLFNLTASHSDHSPIFLCYNPVQYRQKRRSFRFENWWLEEEGVSEVIDGGWVDADTNSVVEKLAGCAAELQRWHRLRSRQKNEERDLILAQLELYRGSVDPVNAARYMEAHNEYNKILIQDDTY
ncbi:uncharacterized protein LOC131613489 [Vicia villosa]|uniref:uncharacterized protein LOC131613489 n=1 Tax=Vicia villosa TaxID=3911 RepID=UPI00273A7ACF|nr:uncharacterized protein LOC131613489 [Vicia villosa]